MIQSVTKSGEGTDSGDYKFSPNSLIRGGQLMCFNKNEWAGAFSDHRPLVVGHTLMRRCSWVGLLVERILNEQWPEEEDGKELVMSGFS